MPRPSRTTEPLTRLEPDERQKAFNAEVFALVERHLARGLSPIEQLAIVANILGVTVGIQTRDTTSDEIHSVIDRNMHEGLSAFIRLVETENPTWTRHT